MEWASAAATASWRPWRAAGQLPDALDDLGEAGGGQRMAARLEPARGIDGQASVEARSRRRASRGRPCPAGSRPMSSSEISSNGAKASWISAKSTRSGPKPAIANAARAAAWVARKLREARDDGGRPGCPSPARSRPRGRGRALSGQHDRGRAVGDRAAVQQAQRIGHHAALHDFFRSDRICRKCASGFLAAIARGSSPPPGRSPAASVPVSRHAAPG